MSNLSWLLYCACSVLYINALLTNMCYQKLRFIEQLCIFLYSTVLLLRFSFQIQFCRNSNIDCEYLSIYYRKAKASFN